MSATLSLIAHITFISVAVRCVTPLFVLHRMGGGGMGFMGGGAGAKVVLRAEEFDLEGCGLLLLKHLTSELVHLDKHLLSRLKVKELGEEKLDHSEDFDSLRLMHRLSSVYNVVTSPDSMKIEDGKFPHVHRALPSRTLDMPRSKDDCNSETDVVSLRIDSEKHGPNDNAHGHGHGHLLIARVLHFVVKVFCDKTVRERGRRYEASKVFVGKKEKGNESQTSRSGSRYLLYLTNIESRFIHSVASSNYIKEKVKVKEEKLTRTRKRKFVSPSWSWATWAWGQRIIHFLMIPIVLLAIMSPSFVAGETCPTKSSCPSDTSCTINSSCNSWDPDPPFLVFGTNKEECQLKYEDACDVKFEDNESLSCTCATDVIVNDSGNPTYFVCNENCDQNEPGKVSGYCIQCPAGQYYGEICDNDYAECPSDAPICPSVGLPDPGCTCQIPVNELDTNTCSKTEVNYVFFVVCQHTADISVDSEPTQIGFCSRCQNCPAGTSSEQGDVACSACEKNQYNNDGGSYCKSCPKGSFNTETGSTTCFCDKNYYGPCGTLDSNEVCTACPTGSSNDQTAQSTCTCQKGYFGPNGVLDSSTKECTPCSPGKYQNEVGQPTCISCPSGYYQPNNASITCLPADPGYYTSSQDSAFQYLCPVGSYSTGNATQYCTLCPQGKSTSGTGSTSASDCQPCQYGVDQYTYACRNESTASTSPLNDVCWDVSQSLSLNNGIGIKNLNDIAFNQPEVGVHALIDEAIQTIQAAASSTNVEATSKSILSVMKQLKDAPQNWLDAVFKSSNLNSCIERVSQSICATNDESESTGVNEETLFEYQFGSTNVGKVCNWYAYWQCTGATFGCGGNTTSSCPLAVSCFQPIYTNFASLLSFPGGSAVFGQETV